MKHLFHYICKFHTHVNNSEVNKASHSAFAYAFLSSIQWSFAWVTCTLCHFFVSWRLWHSTWYPACCKVGYFLSLIKFSNLICPISLSWFCEEKGNNWFLKLVYTQFKIWIIILCITLDNMAVQNHFQILNTYLSLYLHQYILNLFKHVHSILRYNWQIKIVYT